MFSTTSTKLIFTNKTRFVFLFVLFYLFGPLHDERTIKILPLKIVLLKSKLTGTGVLTVDVDLLHRIYFQLSYSQN